MPKAPLNVRVVSGKAARYISFRNQKKDIEEAMKPLSVELKDLATEYGEMNDSGTFVLEAGKHKIQSVCKKSNKVDQEALLKLLKGKGLLERCTMRSVNQEEVEACLAEGLLKFSDVQAITKVSKSYSVKVD